MTQNCDTGFEGLVKVAQNWHTAEISQAGLALDKTDEAARNTASTYSQRKADELNKRNEVQNPANQQRTALHVETANISTQEESVQHRGGRNEREQTPWRGGRKDRGHEDRGREDNTSRNDRNARTVREESPKAGARRATVSEAGEIERIKSVRAREVISKGSSRPTLMMRNVTIIPNGRGATYKNDCLPDTGCTQSLILEDIVRRTGM